MGLQAMANRLADSSSWVALQVDFSNAFNTLDRSTLLLAAASRTPSAFNYLRFAPLYVGDSVLASSTGTPVLPCARRPAGGKVVDRDLLLRTRENG